VVVVPLEEEALAARGEDAPDLGQHVCGAGDVLEHPACVHAVEASIREGHPEGSPLDVGGHRVEGLGLGQLGRADVESPQLDAWVTAGKRRRHGPDAGAEVQDAHARPRGEVREHPGSHPDEGLLAEARDFAQVRAAWM
jgi:hypothetical protein